MPVVANLCSSLVGAGQDMVKIKLDWLIMAD